MPVSGNVFDLISRDVLSTLPDGACQEVHFVSCSGPGRNRIRLERKNPAHLAGFMVQSRPRVWKWLRHSVHSSISVLDHKRRRSDQDDGCSCSDQDGGGLIPWDRVQAYVSRFARFSISR